MAWAAMPGWLQIVGARAPGEGAAPFTIHDVSNPASGPGFVSLDCAVTGRQVTDRLNSLKIGGDWVVIAKTFHIRG